MAYQMAGMAILASFYGAYFLKMVAQYRKGIRTDQIGKGKTGFVKAVEVLMKVAAVLMPVCEIISLLLNTTALPEPVRIAGGFLAAMGVGFFISAVVTMRDSWRAGVPEKEKTALVTDGIFQISRNPAFLGFDMVYAGFVLMFFNLPLFFLSLFAILMFHLQIVNVEEDHLLDAFGDEYLTYRKNVSRYFGNRNVKLHDILTLALLMISSLSGIFSWSAGGRLFVTNQYGQLVTLWGNGVYARDSLFKAAGFIGTDVIVAAALMPLFFGSFLRALTENRDLHRLKMSALYAVSSYYSASLCFGAVYNRLILVYIALLGLSFFGLLSNAKGIALPPPRSSKGMTVYLIVLGAALCLAWLPDILPTIVSGTTLPLIEVYTTEVTYVLDMGLISPMCFLSLWFLKQKKTEGVVLTSCLLKICLLAGLMIAMQSVCQAAAGIEIPIQICLTKVVIFVVLSVFSFILQRKWYRELESRVSVR